MQERANDYESNEPPRADVSVIITCKDLEAYLGEAVESVWGQTVHPKEVIVIHDGCEKPQFYKGTTTVFRENNIGVARSRDEGVRLATCGHLLFLDADDALAENYLQEMISALEKGADVAYPHNLLWARWGEATFANVWYAAPEKLTLKAMLKMNRVVVSSLMKREVYRKVGGFDPTLEVFEDWDFFLKAIIKGFRFALANTYLKYRQRTQSRNRQNEAAKKKVWALMQKRYGSYLEGKDAKEKTAVIHSHDR